MIYGKSTKIQLVTADLVSAALVSFTTPFDGQTPEAQAIITEIRDKIIKIKYYLTNGTMDLRMGAKHARQHIKLLKKIDAILMKELAEKSGLDYLNLLLVLISDIVSDSHKLSNKELAKTWKGLDTLLTSLYEMDDPEIIQDHDIEVGQRMANKIKEVMGV